MPGSRRDLIRYTLASREFLLIAMALRQNYLARNFAHEKHACALTVSAKPDRK